MEHENILKDLIKIVTVFSSEDKYQRTYLSNLGIPEAFDEISFEFDSAIEGISENDQLKATLNSSQLKLLGLIAEDIKKLDGQGAIWSSTIVYNPIWSDIRRRAKQFLCELPTAESK